MQDKLPDKPEIVDSYELERLIYNLRHSHHMLGLFRDVIDELAALPSLSSLEEEKSQLQIAITTMKKNNENHALDEAIKILQKKFDTVEHNIVGKLSRSSVVEASIKSYYSWYLSVINLLREKDYIGELEKEGKSVREFDLHDHIIITAEQQMEERKKKLEAEKGEGPIPRRLSGILSQNPIDPPPASAPANSDEKNIAGISP